MIQKFKSWDYPMLNHCFEEKQRWTMQLIERVSALPIRILCSSHKRGLKRSDSRGKILRWKLLKNTILYNMCDMYVLWQIQKNYSFHAFLYFRRCPLSWLEIRLTLALMLARLFFIMLVIKYEYIWRKFAVASKSTFQSWITNMLKVLL